MSIGNIFTKANMVKYATKGAGLAALGIIGYDAHILGRMQADSYAKRKDANACMQTYSNTQYLSSPSSTTSKMKGEVHKFEMDSNIRHFINSTIGYFRGALQMMVNDVVPLGLGIGALFAKGKLAKGSAIGLGIYAGVKFFKDVLGFGHYNDLNKKY